MRDLRALPKVELHIYLEGAMRVETLDAWLASPVEGPPGTGR
jgi:hypothetical protein